MRKHKGKEVIISGRAEVCTMLYSKLFDVRSPVHVGEVKRAQAHPPSRRPHAQPHKGKEVIIGDMKSSMTLDRDRVLRHGARQ